MCKVTKKFKTNK